MTYFLQNSDGSEASQDSCSHSDSSDSDSSSSSQDSSSSSPTPEFSVTNNQTNGLRMTLTSVRKSNNSPINVINKRNFDENSSKNVIKKKDQRKSSSSSSSNCSSDSSDDSDTDDRTRKSPQKPVVSAVKRNTTIPPKPKVVKSDTSTRNSKEAEKPKHSPLPIKSRLSLQKEGSASKLKLSSSSSSIGSSSREKMTANKDIEIQKTRSHLSRLDTTKNSNTTSQGKQRVSSNTNNLITNSNTAKEQTKEQPLLPKLRSSNSITYTSSGKDRDSQVIGKLRARDKEHRSLREVKETETKDSKTSDSCYSSSSNLNGNSRGKDQETGAGSHKLGEDTLAKEVELKGGKLVEGKTAKRKMKLRKKSKKVSLCCGRLW